MEFEIITTFCQIRYFEKKRDTVYKKRDTVYKKRDTVYKKRDTVYKKDKFEKSSPVLIPFISNSSITLSVCPYVYSPIVGRVSFAKAILAHTTLIISKILL